MALINFDCPHCGHNLEVDERGAGFIVKCPECDNPLEVPALSRARAFRKPLMAAAVGMVVLLLLGVNITFWRMNRSLQEDMAHQQESFGLIQQQAQALADEQESEILRLTQAVADARRTALDELTDAALDAIEEAEVLALALSDTQRRLLQASPTERSALLREHMTQRVAAARQSLPVQPVITDVGPGRGLQGRHILFPVLPGPDGQPLREQAEITSVDEDRLSVRFAGGTATYRASELHPGVSAFLPVDPLLVLPQAQWGAEVTRIHQVRTAQREERLAEIRAQIEEHLPPE